MKKWLIILTLLLFVYKTDAYLLSPPKIEYNFEPNAIFESSFTIINRDVEPVNVLVYVQGDLNQSFSFSENVTSVPAQSSKSISFKIFMPESLKPGSHVNKIIVEQVTSESEQGIGAKVAIGILVPIQVPYPGKYLTADLSAKSININETQEFKVRLYNLGKETISNVVVDIYIYDSNKNNIGKVTETTSNMAATNVRDLILNWDSEGNNAGIYDAIANITYDGIKTDVVTKFRIGDLIIRIKDITYSSIKKGTIGRVNVLIESLWTGDINNVYGQLDIIDNTVLVGSSKSETFSLESAAERNVVLFVDATNLETKEYDGKVTIFYANKTSQRLFKVVISRDFLSRVFIIQGLIILAIIILLILTILNYRKIFKKNTG